MFELLDSIKGMSDEEFTKVKSRVLDYKDLLDYVQYCVSCQDLVVSSHRMVKMMKYFKYEKSEHPHYNSIGEYVAQKMSVAKKFLLTNSNLRLNMSSFSYLMDIMKKLRVEVRNKNQYHILRNTLLLLSYSDTVWFINLLTKNYELDQKVFDLIKLKEINKVSIL